MLDITASSTAASLDEIVVKKRGIATIARTPRIMVTMISSINVKPFENFLIIKKNAEEGRRFYDHLILKVLIWFI